MLNLFNPNKEQKKDSKSEAADSLAAEEMEKEIVVHVMPKHFRTMRQDATQAKTTGLIILVLGILFLAVVGFVFYYFIFVYQPKSKVSTVPDPGYENKTDVREENKQAEKAATSTEAVATTTATTTIPVEEEAVATTTPEIIYTAGKDEDVDMLTDDEESLIGTDKTNPDSDKDGYSDFDELSKLYNPSGPGKLDANPKFAKFENSVYSYSFLYPSAWQVKNISDDSVKIGFKETAENSENENPVNKQFIEINISPNYKKQLIGDWYKDQFSISYIEPARFVDHADINGQADWQGVRNEDKLTLYATDKNYENIYTIHYNLGLGTTLNYMNLFDFIIKNFSIGK